MNVNIGAWDVTVCLLAAALGLRLAFWGSRRLYAKHVRNASTAPAAAQQIPSKAAPPRPPVLAIVAASLRLPHGASIQALAAALAGRHACTGLDPELVDDDGIPVMTARSGAAGDQA